MQYVRYLKRRPLIFSYSRSSTAPKVFVGILYYEQSESYIFKKVTKISITLNSLHDCSKYLFFGWKYELARRDNNLPRFRKMERT